MSSSLPRVLHPPGVSTPPPLAFDMTSLSPSAVAVAVRRDSRHHSSLSCDPSGRHGWPGGHKCRGWVGEWVGGCLTSQQQASVSQGRICLASQQQASVSQGRICLTSQQQASVSQGRICLTSQQQVIISQDGFCLTSQQQASVSQGRICLTSQQHASVSQGRICLTSQQYASVYQGRICSDECTCCHTEIEVAAQTFYLT